MRVPKPATSIAFASLCVAWFAFLASLLIMMSNQVQSRKVQAIEFNRKNLDVFTPERMVVWSEIAKGKAEDIRARMFPTDEQKKLDSVKADRQWRVEANFVLNQFELQAVTYNSHAIDRRIMWDEGADELVTKGGIQHFINILDPVPGWESKVKTFRLYQAHLLKGRPSTWEDWTDMPLDNNIAAWGLGVTWLGIGVVATVYLIRRKRKDVGSEGTSKWNAARERIAEQLLDRAHRDSEILDGLTEDVFELGTPPAASTNVPGTGPPPRDTPLPADPRVVQGAPETPDPSKV